MANKLSARLINVLNQSGFNGNYFISEYEYLEILEKYKKFDIYLSDSAKELLNVFGNRVIIYENNSIRNRNYPYEISFNTSEVLGKLRNVKTLKMILLHNKEKLCVEYLIPIAVMPSGPMLFCLDDHDNIHGILDSLILHYCGRNVWNSFEKVLDGDDVNKK